VSPDATDQSAIEAAATPEATDQAATKHHKHRKHHDKKKASDSEVTEATAATTEEASTTEEVTAPVTDQASTTDSTAPATEEAATTATTDSSVLNDVPENTTVTVLDANGESQPLATQDAAEAIATTTDPVWCPGTQAPTPGANGCTDSFTSFDALLTFLSTNPTYQGAGTIYVEQGAYTGGETNIDFNNYNLSNISNSDLTVTGGWNTSNNTVDSTSTSSFVDIPIIIGSSTNPWGGSLTLNNLTLSFDPHGSVSGSGITLYSQGSININNVTVTHLPTGAGAELNAGGDVTVNTSKFDENRTAGAIIKAGGNVTVADSSFSNAPNRRRQVVGLDITGANVTLSSVLANQDREAGANINASGAVVIGSSFFSDTKEMSGSGASTTFLGYGLQVVTPSTIAMTDVTANNNFLWGASLQAGQNISIANSVFNSNTTASPGFIDDTGLVIKGGSTVSLSNVQANLNRLYGATIDAVGNVSITGSQFSDNRGTIINGTTPTYHGTGLQVTTLADLTIQDTSATNNMLFGGQLNAGGAVSISGGSFSNTSTGSSADVSGKGLDIVSGGNTSLYQVVLDNNQTAGATIQAGGFVWPDTVTATNNGTDGIAVQTTCTHLSSGTYTGNGQYGLNLGTSALDLLSQPTFANNGAGDIFPANPPTCAFAFGGTNTTGGTSTAANIFTSFKLSSGGVVSSSANMSLSSFLANSKTANGSIASIFFGKYGYVYSDSGFQVFAFAPATNELAMSGS
jgi:hypothetical protein